MSCSAHRRSWPRAGPAPSCSGRGRRAPPSRAPPTPPCRARAKERAAPRRACAPPRTNPRTAAVPPGLRIPGRPVRLERVTLNPTGHAPGAAAGPAPPGIRTRARAAADPVSIAVADNGHGISAAEIDRIFDPFFPTKPLGKGLGLGLSISYGIVQDFGGQIHANNHPEGGAELTVELPRHRRETAPVEKAIHA